jgi:hypothetical protein
MKSGAHSESLGGRLDDRARGVEHKHVGRLHALLHHAARRHDDAVADADGDAAAGAGDVALEVEARAELGDERLGLVDRRHISLAGAAGGGRAQRRARGGGRAGAGAPVCGAGDRGGRWVSRWV